LKHVSLCFRTVILFCAIMWNVSMQITLLISLMTLKLNLGSERGFFLLDIVGGHNLTTTREIGGHNLTTHNRCVAAMTRQYILVVCTCDNVLMPAP